MIQALRSALPAVWPEPLLGLEARLVAHLAAARDPVAEIDVRQAEATGILDVVEDTVVDTFVTEYRVRPPIDRGRAGENDGELVGVALCDRLSDGISMVYSFYDADDARRSLGSYIILDHIEYARRLGLPYVYLGYWISGSRKMRYKTRFKPQERLGPNGWERV